jgi:hypothetical protein
VVLVACSKEPAALDPALLASDVSFNIGGHKVVVPVVTVRGPDAVFSLGRREPNPLNQMLAKASDPNSPLQVDTLPLAIRPYQSTGERLESSKICPLLTRRWAQAVCRDEQSGILKRLPEKFDLFDRQKIEILKRHLTIGGETEYDHVSGMVLRPGTIEIGCDKASKFCTAAVEALPGLLAIWTVWGTDNADAEARSMAREQASAIIEFVQRAIGPSEDVTLLTAD